MPWRPKWRVTADSVHLRLTQSASDLGLDLSNTQRDALQAYLELIQKWNKVYNLTAVRDPAEMLTHHLLDSLAVVGPLRRHLSENLPDQKSVKLLDVGAGAGLPGVVIAACCPQVQVTCVDTVAKKAAFVQQVAASLQLPNLRGLHARVEAIIEPHEVVCSRAFASLIDFTNWSQGALAEQGVWLAMKGKHPADEIAALPPQTQVFHVEPLAVPGLDAQRCIVWLKKQPGIVQALA